MAIRSATERRPAPGPRPTPHATGTAPGRPLRVLVVGINFAPEHTGIAPYTTQLSEYLAAEGASVSVLTGVPHYPGWTVPAENRWRRSRTERRGRLHVRRLRHYVPRTQTALRRGLYELTFALHVALTRRDERPDVVLAVVPSLFSALVAERIARRAGVPFVVWTQDLMGRAASQSGMQGGSHIAGLVDAVEKRVLRAADHVMVLNEHFAEHVRSLGVGDARIEIRPNWAHVAGPTGRDRAATRARMGWAPDETIVLHTGNMGLKQGLENVIGAGRIAQQNGVANIRFVLMGDGSQREPLQAAAAGVTTVEFAPPAASPEYPDILAAADILLVNEVPTAEDMSLPSKLTSYFAAGRPVLAACSASGGTAAQVATSSAGIVVAPGAPARLLSAALDLGARPDACAELGRNGRAFAEHVLDADTALERMATSIRGLVPGGDPTPSDRDRGRRRMELSEALTRAFRARSNGAEPRATTTGPAPRR